ncbi:MAG TPA: ATP-binding protein [Acidimicrobiales bacterium]|jgi:signal transduction histidine kinase|nr:ATP-binding protein [Acidimicrobiales bacterium]
MRQRSLRLRLLITFGLGALILSGLFATLTYEGVHGELVNDLQHTDLHESYENAELVRSTLYSSPNNLNRIMNSIEKATGSGVLVQTHGEWLSRSKNTSTDEVPTGTVKKVSHGEAVTQIRDINNRLIYVVGVPIPSVETQFFEVFPMNPLERSLDTLMLVLILAALATSLIGISGGLWVARRTVRPLERVSLAAGAIAAGNLTTRLQVTRADREVQQLTQSFNEMVSQLVERLERDARFASDVSHELRSPLTTLATTASVLVQHREELSAAGQESLDLLTADLAIFQSLVEDLLEMARGDAGAVPLVIETVAAVELVRQSVRSAVRRHGLAEPPIEVMASLEDPFVSVDRRRFERVMANLIDNAHYYAGGATAVRLGVEDGLFTINVDDAGAGVPLEERESIFERFFRGRAAHDRGIARGTGLGLALVRDHVRAIGGTIQVLESPDGGARFQILLPLVDEGAP